MASESVMLTVHRLTGTDHVLMTHVRVHEDIEDLTLAIAAPAEAHMESDCCVSIHKENGELRCRLGDRKRGSVSQCRLRVTLPPAKPGDRTPVVVGATWRWPVSRRLSEATPVTLMLAAPVIVREARAGVA